MDLPLISATLRNSSWKYFFSLTRWKVIALSKIFHTEEEMESVAFQLSMFIWQVVWILKRASLIPGAYLINHRIPPLHFQQFNPLLNMIFKT